MSTDLRDRFQQAAPEPDLPLDVSELYRRGHRRRRFRQVTAVAAAVVVVAVAVIVGTDLLTDRAAPYIDDQPGSGTDQGGVYISDFGGWGIEIRSQGDAWCLTVSQGALSGDHGARTAAGECVPVGTITEPVELRGIAHGDQARLAWGVTTADVERVVKVVDGEQTNAVTRSGSQPFSIWAVPYEDAPPDLIAGLDADGQRIFEASWVELVGQTLAPEVRMIDQLARPHGVPVLVVESDGGICVWFGLDADHGESCGMTNREDAVVVASTVLPDGTTGSGVVAGRIPDPVTTVTLTDNGGIGETQIMDTDAGRFFVTGGLNVGEHTLTASRADGSQYVSGTVDVQRNGTSGSFFMPDAEQPACLDDTRTEVDASTVLVHFRCGWGPDPLRARSRSAPDGGLDVLLPFAVDQFAEGPASDERDRGYARVFPGDPSLLVDVEYLADTRTALVSFDPAIRQASGIGTSTATSMFIDGLQATVFQFDEVDTLRLEIDGECWPIDPYGRCTFQN